MESIRVVMLRNWYFDILNSEHWEIAWDLWANSWVISEPKEWAFVLIIISFIPLWFTGWIALSLVSWGKFFLFVITLPWKLFKNLFYKPVRIITVSAGVSPVRRKKSYKEIRPRAVKSTFNDRMELSSPKQLAPSGLMGGGMGAPMMPPPSSTPLGHPMTPPQPQQPRNFDHSLFKFDDTFEDVDFDIDAFEVEPKKPNDRRRPPNDFERESGHFEPRREDNRGRNRDQERDNRDRNSRDRNRDRPDNRERNRDKDRGERREDRRDDRAERNAPPAAMMPNNSRQTSGSVPEILQQKGYQIIPKVSLKNTIVDYIAISANRICLCLLDREPGDWLADEERFNDEEPLWFSESSHRISPVRKIDLARQYLLNHLDETGLDFRVDAYVIVQIGNIINAEDMFETWENLHVHVTRIDRGTPKEIRLFARALPDADKPVAPGKFEKLGQLIRNL